MRSVLFAAVAAAVLCAASAQFADQCTCMPTSLCGPLTTPPPAQEILAFHPSASASIEHYDMSFVTTVAVFGEEDPEQGAVCYAHQYGVRVVRGVGFPQDQLTNATFQAQWIDTQLAAAQQLGLDGVNLDIEGNTHYRNELTAFTAKVKAAFSAWSPNTQVTFDTGVWATASSPGYDIAALANATDFLVPMAYDMCWGTRVAKANSPLPEILADMKRYEAAGVPRTKIVLGLPWYGYDFVCNTTAPGTPCDISVPFGGGSWQRTYADILTLRANNATSETVLDAPSQSKHFDYTDAADGVRHQVWYDDPSTLGVKYAAAARLGLRGVGFWHADCLDPGSQPEQSTAMWRALANFTGNPNQ